MKLFIVLSFIGLAFGHIVPSQDFALPAGLNKIVGGEKAVLGEFPYQISIREFFDNPLTHICGGSIINENWILTAGHCCVGLPILFHTTAGDVDTYVNEGTEQHIDVKTIIQHPEYSAQTFANDICLLELKESFVFDENVGPVTLPEPMQPIEAGSSVTVTGYGVTREGGIFTSEFLRKVDLPVVSDEECAAAYVDMNEVIESMICAGDIVNGGIDACQGDSGGPYVITGTNTQVGVVSWGRGCAEVGYPGVNTEVSYFLDWIQETIAAA